jgi:hypothetical protein
MSPHNDIYCELVGGDARMPATLRGSGHMPCEVFLLLVAALVASLAKQLAVLLLGHTLAALLNN